MIDKVPPVLAAFSTHAAVRAALKARNLRSMWSLPVKPTMLPPIWLVPVSSRNVAPAPPSVNVALPRTEPPLPSSNVPAWILMPPVMTEVY